MWVRPIHLSIKVTYNSRLIPRLILYCVCSSIIRLFLIIFRKFEYFQYFQERLNIFRKFEENISLQQWKQISCHPINFSVLKNQHKTEKHGNMRRVGRIWNRILVTMETNKVNRWRNMANKFGDEYGDTFGNYLENSQYSIAT
jgi:hypothetical protein